MHSISDNLKRIKENIEIAAERSGRSPSEITLIGVTKTIGIDRIAELLALGVGDLGENRVQELLAKYELLEETPRWHMIGHLQTNKVKFIVDKVKLIHSVDSIRLANEIDKQAKAKNMVSDILIEVNAGEEVTKFGARINDVYELIEKMMFLENITIKGLMTVAPYVENPEKNRIIFEKMVDLFVDIRNRFDDNKDMVFLSMGMTNDYQVAIEQGANMVRIGTGIFGGR